MVRCTPGPTRLQVAAEAIKQAERDGQHVVLVDTAGRMQVRGFW